MFTSWGITHTNSGHGKESNSTAILRTRYNHLEQRSNRTKQSALWSWRTLTPKVKRKVEQQVVNVNVRGPLLLILAGVYVQEILQQTQLGTSRGESNSHQLWQQWFSRCMYAGTLLNLDQSILGPWMNIFVSVFSIGGTRYSYLRTDLCIWGMFASIALNMTTLGIAFNASVPVGSMQLSNVERS